MIASGEWNDPGFDTVARIRALLDHLGVDAGADPLATASAFLDVHEPELARQPTFESASSNASNESLAPLDPLEPLAPRDDPGARVAELETALAENQRTTDQLRAELVIAHGRVADLEAEVDAHARRIGELEAVLAESAAGRDASAAVLAAARAEAEMIRRDALVTAAGLRQIAREDARELRRAVQATSSRER